MLIDGFGRRVDYIRISVTNRCNFRCQYCMPDTPEDLLEESEEEIPLPQLLEVVKVAVDEGVQKIRITGGEPMIRKGLNEFIASIYRYAPSIDIALTTNGFFLRHFAQPLKEAGLKRINVSLDSLKPSVVQLISKKNVLPQILEGIDEALRVGLIVKLNMVPIKGVNHEEIPDILTYAHSRGITVRFIEFMENDHAKGSTVGLTLEEILREVGRCFTYRKIEKDHFGPATLYETEEGAFFGIIAPHSDDFCESCNRVRISSDGQIIPCLYFEDAIDLKGAILSGDREGIRQGIFAAVARKPEKNEWKHEENQISKRAFYQTGG